MFVPLAIVFAVPAPALGQVPLEDLATGDTIRFRLEGWTFDLRRLLHGRFEDPTSAGIVYTALPSEERGVLPYDAIERLDVRRGRRSYVLEGAAIGALGGCVIGWGAGQDASGCGVGAGLGVVVLGIAGRILKTDRWREVRVPTGRAGTGSRRGT